MESFYIRIRGRVLGPYDTEKLQSLAVRGQLSKMHEVSTDGISWVRASTFPELFEVKQRDPATSGDGQCDPGVAEQPLALGQASPEHRGDVGSVWHYSVNGKQMPPTDFAGLQWLVTTGVVGLDTQVWQEGMRQWVSARAVSGLSWPASGALNAQDTSNAGFAQKSRDDLPTLLCHAALGSRTWAMFLAILGLVSGAIIAVYGVCMLLLGASRHLEVLVVMGIGSFVQATLMIIGSRFLLGYAATLGGLRYAASSSLLTQSLESLRKFWMFTGITVIVILAILLLFFIAGFAGAVSMRDFAW